jgi:hypothetical protein
LHFQKTSEFRTRELCDLAKKLIYLEKKISTVVEWHFSLVLDLPVLIKYNNITLLDLPVTLKQNIEFHEKKTVISFIC